MQVYSSINKWYRSKVRGSLGLMTTKWGEVNQKDCRSFCMLGRGVKLIFFKDFYSRLLYLVFLLYFPRVQRGGDAWKMMLASITLSCMLSVLLFRWYALLTPLQLASNLSFLNAWAFVKFISVIPMLPSSLSDSEFRSTSLFDVTLKVLHGINNILLTSAGSQRILSQSDDYKSINWASRKGFASPTAEGHPRLLAAS